MNGSIFIRKVAAFAARAKSLLKSKPCCARALTPLWAVLLILPFASVARGQSGSETIGFFGTLGQGNASVNGTQAVKNNSCAPTAVTNGLTYLENYLINNSQADPFNTTPNTYTQLNNLQSGMSTGSTGTSLTNLWSGLQTYSTSHTGGTVTLSGQQDLTTVTGLGWGSQAGATNAIPTATFLANALNANDGVEVSIEWGSYSGSTWTPKGGGHELTLDAINTAGSTIGFIDPWGASNTANAATSALSISATWTLSNGYIYVTYPNPTGTNDIPDDVTPGDGTTTVGSAPSPTGRILADTVEGVPEPGTAALALLGGVGLLMRRRR